MEIKERKIAVIGLGYVGLPLAIRCLEKGYDTIGVDLDQRKLDAIMDGKSPFKEEFIEERLGLLKKLNVSNNPSNLVGVDIILICVPTPVDEQFYPDLNPVKGAIKMCIENRKPGQLVVVESTINPGVCEEVVEPMFQEAGLEEGKDYYLAHCPERIDPGNEKWNVTNIPRVVGSMSQKGVEMAKAFYDSIIDGEVRAMKSIREAEATKVVENSFRDINIAFVNELAKSFDQMGIDVKDVILGAATKPFAFMAHFPGRGVGGHCIPVDPYYLIEQAKKKGFDHHFLRVAREINNSMPNYTVELMQDLLNNAKLPVKGTKIGVMGLSYKANIDDLRESPAIKIIKELEKKNADIVRFDPYILDMSDVKTVEEFLEEVQAIILVTNHKDFMKITPEQYKESGIVAIVDGMNALESEEIKSLGIEYHGIGRR